MLQFLLTAEHKAIAAVINRKTYSFNLPFKESKYSIHLEKDQRWKKS